MMKKFFLILAGMSFLSAGWVEAKYVMPKDSLPAAERQARKKSGYQMRTLDKDGDGKLSLEEFKSRKLSREDRRIIRRQKKEGTYKSPEEIFKAMDADKGGYITLEQMTDFYAGREPQPTKQNEPEGAASSGAENEKNAPEAEKSLEK